MARHIYHVSPFLDITDLNIWQIYSWCNWKFVCTMETVWSILKEIVTVFKFEWLIQSILKNVTFMAHVLHQIYFVEISGSFMIIFQGKHIIAATFVKYSYLQVSISLLKMIRHHQWNNHFDAQAMPKCSLKEQNNVDAHVFDYIYSHILFISHFSQPCLHFYLLLYLFILTNFYRIFWFPPIRRQQLSNDFQKTKKQHSRELEEFAAALRSSEEQVRYLKKELRSTNSRTCDDREKLREALERMENGGHVMKNHRDVEVRILSLCQVSRKQAEMRHLGSYFLSGHW